MYPADIGGLCRTRLYSAKTGKPLAVLPYHRSSLQAVAFAPMRAQGLNQERDADEDQEDVPRYGWLAVAGADERISLWEIYLP